MYYKQYFHTIVIFSPTVKNDDKWDYVKKQPLLAENVKLKKFLKKLEEKKNELDFVSNRHSAPIEGTKVDIVTGHVEKKDKFDPKIPESCFIEEYKEEDLIHILAEQQKMIDLLSANGKSKHLANRYKK